MYESKKQARKKQRNRQRHKDSNLHRVSKANDESVSQTPAGLSEGHLASAAALGLCWLVLACLARAALFRRACAWKNFSGPKKISPPASFATQYHDKMNFQSLAWWNTWPLALFGRPAPEKKLFGPYVFFPPASSAT